MKLTFDTTVSARLTALVEARPAIWALDYDDSLTPDGTPDSCDIVTRFRLVALSSKAQLPKEFDATLTTTAGDVYYKSYGERFMDQTMELRAKSDGARFEMMGAGGLLSDNAEIADYRDVTIKKASLVKAGASCDY